MIDNTYVVATIKDWNIEAFHRFTPELPGRWHLISSQDELSIDALEALNPRYIFFPHWSWIVPSEILEAYECVCFHMTDVPYGRGGSPLQNLIERGHKDTMVSALRMADELDAGPVYLKKPLSLEGSAQDIFERFVPISYACMKDIVENESQPQPQDGDVVVFKRRTPDMSALPQTESLEKLYDHIRMLDADSYPKAFVEHGDFKIYFEDASLEGDDELQARVKIVRKDQT